MRFILLGVGSQIWVRDFFFYEVCSETDFLTESDLSTNKPSHITHQDVSSDELSSCMLSSEESGDDTNADTDGNSEDDENSDNDSDKDENPDNDGNSSDGTFNPSRSSRKPKKNKSASDKGNQSKSPMPTTKKKPEPKALPDNEGKAPSAGKSSLNPNPGQSSNKEGFKRARELFESNEGESKDNPIDVDNFISLFEPSIVRQYVSGCNFISIFISQFYRCQRKKSPFQPPHSLLGFNPRKSLLPMTPMGTRYT